MIKDCPVKLNNECVTVVSFGDINIQFPSIHRDAKTVRVLYKDGKYSVVDDKYVDTANSKNTKKRSLNRANESIGKITNKEKAEENDGVQQTEVDKLTENEGINKETIPVQ